jgi:alpha-mannosidase
MLFFTEEKIVRLLADIHPTIYRETQDIPTFKFIEADPSGAQHPDFDDSGWRDFHVMDYWGGYDVTAWFRVYVPIPAYLRDKKVALRFLIGPRDGGDSTAETQLYVNGFPLQAIDVWHEEAWLPPEYLQEDSIFIALRAWSSVLGVPDRRRFKLAQLNWIDEGAEGFYFLADNLLKTVQALDVNDWSRVKLLEKLNESFQYIRFTKPRSDDYYARLETARQFLQDAITEWQSIDSPKPTVIGVGHSHIDLAWLWRRHHVREKAARTFSTVLHLMRQYPEFRFMHSSPALYKAISEEQPELFERIKAKIASGEWEITGGMWVEPDTNIPSGESLIRQILFAKRYIRETFGQETTVLWLPDVFGYTGSLPQLIIKSGLKYFMTTKLSWNQFNRFPYDTFRWRGIDGSEVLTHFITTPEENSPHQTYNGTLQPYEIKGIWDNYLSKSVNDELLLAFGWGDGGGGPTREMLEAARVMKNLPGLPRVEIGKVEPYFAHLEERLKDKTLPVWDDELYLELHRGTYTSQAVNKRANRKSEVLYHDAEFLAALADILLGENQYPDLSEGWELILFNQFHDVLPGSSIRQVYEDSAQDYQRVSEIGHAALDEARNRILANIKTEAPSLVVFNTLPWKRSNGIVEVPWSPELEGKVVASENKYGQPVASQVVEDDGQKKLLIELPEVVSAGYQTFPLTNPPPSSQPNSIRIEPNLLENEYLQVKLNDAGQITSVLYKPEQWEILAPGERGNVFQAFEDKPRMFDAWDIELFYQEKMQEVTDLIEAVVEETGPLRGTLRLKWHFYDSTITQRISLYRNTSYIDFRTKIDWREQQVMLKVAFPVNIRSTRATYDIQFGSIERPTHWNTSWDWARFEVVGHKYADLSEGNHGVALLNDCKYGYDVKDNVLRLTLLRSPIRPDALADKRHHEFTYRLLPHESYKLDSDEVIQTSYDLNYPLSAILLPAQAEGRLPDSFSLCEPDHRVIVETIKLAEDGDGWIVRVYEPYQNRYAFVNLRFALPLRHAIECNLVEEGEMPVQYEDDTLTFPINPFEIKTFRVWF